MANHEIDVSAGDPVQEWSEYGLALLPIHMNDEDTGRRHVVRNGSHLDSVTDRYKLLPNEEAVSAANEVAQRVGAEPFHEFDGDWFAQLDDHVYQDSERRRVHAAYAWQTGEIGGDDMEYGFIVHNSIDGSLGFRVGLFSFRHACMNMMLMGISQMPENVESEREVLNETARKHTQGLDLDNLEAIIEGTLVLVDDVHDAYQSFADTAISEAQVDALLRKAEKSRLSGDDLPDWMGGIEEALDDARDNESLDGEHEGLDPERRQAIVADSTPDDLPVWDVYNSVSENLWHDDGTNDMTKQRKMRHLHRVFPVSENLK